MKKQRTPKKRQKMTAVRAHIEGETKESRKRPQRGSKKQPAQARESVTSETEQRATNQEQESKPEPAQRLPENPPQDRQSRTEGQAARTNLLSGSAPMSSAK